MTAAKSRAVRRARRTQAGPDFAARGRRGKQALRASILALRKTGPVKMLEWINEDFILRNSFNGLHDLRRSRTWRLTDPGATLLSETTTMMSVSVLRARVREQLRVVGAGDSIKNYAKTILDRLENAPAPWLARFRRCPYENCERPYFWDATDNGARKYCSEKHKKAVARSRPAAH
jgi:hypothetical protein